MSQPTPILLVDDQPLLRAGFRLVLDDEPDLTVVGEADDGQQAVVMTKTLRPALVLMDVQMPRKDGIQATREILAAVPETKVVLLTTFDVTDYVTDGLRAGAAGFLLKDVQPDDLLAALRSIRDGHAFLSPASTRHLLDAAVPRLRAHTTSDSDGRLEQLTAREREILIAMARGASNRDVAKTMFIAEGTVKIHVGRILAKLQVRDRLQAVVLAYELGLVEPGTR